MSINQRLKHKDDVYMKAANMLPRLKRKMDAATREYEATLRFAQQKEAELAELWAERARLEAQA